MPHCPNKEEEREMKFNATITRAAEGQFIAALPFKRDLSQLDESETVAVKLLHLMEKCCNRLSAQKELYNQFMAEYQKLTYMTELAYRDSSVTTTDVSLNDLLMTGATMQKDLFVIILRFRHHAVVIITDIAKIPAGANKRGKQELPANTVET
ncbi:hypothetical protein KM043_016483 [Ampulex compressa]|nr:hypothetical protein KM043_016483 [Ampulex compressa]